jgi:hypothetical protein
MNQTREKSAFERHAQSILSAVILATILWIGNSVSSTNQKVAELTLQLGFVSTQIQEMRTQMKDDRLDTRVRLQEHEARLKSLEAWVAAADGRRK